MRASSRSPEWGSMTTHPAHSSPNRSPSKASNLAGQTNTYPQMTLEATCPRRQRGYSFRGGGLVGAGVLAYRSGAH